MKEDQNGKVTAVVLAKKAKSEVLTKNKLQLIYSQLDFEVNTFALKQISKEYFLQDWFLYIL